MGCGNRYSLIVCMTFYELIMSFGYDMQIRLSVRKIFVLVVV